MGTPLFAAQILENLLANDQIEIVALYAQPDREKGRGKKVQEPETKTLAKKFNIPIYQPLTFKNNEESLEELKSLKPDVLIVAAYGMLLPQAVLDIPNFGAFNVHASLLPKYRGAAPVQRSLMAGDKLTGITIMKMEAGLDTGPIVLQQAVKIHDDEDFSDNSASLLSALAEQGGKLMQLALTMLIEKRITYIEQNNELATHAPKLNKQEAQIKWQNEASQIHNHIRGYSPNPGASSNLHIDDKDGILARIEKGFVLEKTDMDLEQFYKNNNFQNSEISNGTILGIYKNYIVVKCGKEHYGITQIKLAGKNSMDAKAFHNGYLKNSKNIYFE